MPTHKAPAYEVPMGWTVSFLKAIRRAHLDHCQLHLSINGWKIVRVDGPIFREGRQFTELEGNVYHYIGQIQPLRHLWGSLKSLTEKYGGPLELRINMDGSWSILGSSREVMKGDELVKLEVELCLRPLEPQHAPKGHGGDSP
jgi:hypothetical protein